MILKQPSTRSRALPAAQQTILSRGLNTTGSCFLNPAEYECGASLIDEQWAMTAAHCTKGIAASNMQVRVHRRDIYGGAGEHDCAETLKIADKFENPNYNEVTLENDIALLRLKKVHKTL